MVDSEPQSAAEPAFAGTFDDRKNAKRARVRHLAAAALVAAIMVVLGPVALPIGPVPITLQVFTVVLAALLLPTGWAAAAMAVYAALGAAGVPVYAHGTGGLGVLLGPTGGYIVGFVFAAAAGAWARAAVRRAFRPGVADTAAALVAVLVVYVAGWAWLAFGPTHVSAPAAFAGGVAPFLVPDLIKGGVAVVIATAVRKAMSA